MTIRLKPEIEKKLEERAKAGNYQSTEELVYAVLEQYMSGDFEAGELDKLLGVGEEQAGRGELVEGEEVFRRLKARCEATGRMSGYFLTQQAESDLQHIWDYIAANNIEAADAVAGEFRETFEIGFAIFSDCIRLASGDGCDGGHSVSSIPC